MSDPAVIDFLDTAQSSRVWLARVVTEQSPLVRGMIAIGSGMSSSDISVAAGYTLGEEAALGAKAWEVNARVVRSRPAGYEPLSVSTNLSYWDEKILLQSSNQYPNKEFEDQVMTQAGALLYYHGLWRADTEASLEFGLDFMTLDGDTILFDGDLMVLSEDHDSRLIYEGFIFYSQDGQLTTEWERGTSTQNAVFEVPYTGFKDWVVRPSAGSNLFQTAPGGTLALWSGADMEEMYRQTSHAIMSHWILDLPANYSPRMLLTSRGVLVAGAGFHVRGDKMIITQDPAVLWPGNVVVSLGGKFTGGVCRSDVLRADRIKSSGIEVARYLRQDQSIKSFERALQEIAGLPVTESRLVRIEPQAGKLILHFEDGTALTLSGTRLKVGQKANLLLRCLPHAEGWTRSISFPIPSSTFYPVGDDAPSFSRDPIAVTRRLTGVEVDLGHEKLEMWLKDHDPLLGEYTGLNIDQTGTIDLQESLLQRYGRRIIVVDTSLAIHDPLSWKSVKDFALNNRPAGSLVIIQ